MVLDLKFACELAARMRRTSHAPHQGAADLGSDSGIEIALIAADIRCSSCFPSCAGRASKPGPAYTARKAHQPPRDELVFGGANTLNCAFCSSVKDA